ncbi:low temperature requirement protein A [Micromonospora sp. NBC_00898]|uniref:low temperature requirement protein A n=1 Tax=Micromonospora sp. NBC_00898 TaxID=2975981 RepID=UPI00386AEAB7|nr:low temperature requirement protein A [Micromonospora sp. NBC_00898]
MELFFDLVYVFAITHVTKVVADEPSIGVARGGVILALLWWVWVCYAWLGNAVRADEGVVRIAMFAAAMIMYLVASAIPEAFVDTPGVLHGPLLLITCYLAVRMLHALTYWYVSRDGRSRQLLGATGPALVASALLVCAALVPRLTDDRLWINVGQDLLWLFAIVVEFGAGFAILKGWQIRSAKMWADRHKIIIIIALGEAFLALGLGGTEIPISWTLIVADLLGIAVSATLWWAYFDIPALAGERALQRSSGAARVALARDAYSYLHLPMIAGIVLFSLGLKKTLDFVKHLEEHGMGARLDSVGLGAMYIGVIIYLLGGSAFQLRTTGRASGPRVGAAVLLAALIPLAARVPAFVAFGMLAAVAVGFIAVEVVHFKATRRELHESLLREEQ